MIHHGFRGDVAAYEHYRRQAELHAIARGTTWQIETWIAGPISVIALQLHDALSMKSASEQMRRTSEELPSLVVHARHMRGVYLLLRGKHAEAVPFLADCLQAPPGRRVAWAHCHGVLARAYNRLGEHARAHATCLRVFEHSPREHFEYSNLNLIVQTEHAIAEAGLGRVEQARELLAGLRARHGASQNPLLRGQMFETGLEIALIERDATAARLELLQLELVHRPLSIPSLAQHCEVLAARVARLAGGQAARSQLPPMAAANANSELWWTTGEPIEDEGLPQLAERALQLLAQASRASHGALYVVDSNSTLQLGASLAAEQTSALIQRWVSERLARELEDERTLLQTESSPGAAPWNLMREGTREYRMLVLTTAEGLVIALAVLGREDVAPLPCRSGLLRAMADRLHEAVCEERTERSSLLAGERSD
jgi:tetratricopeptide (TPR) repeat protein